MCWGCHQGRTPPCTEAVIAAGVERVVAAMRDPNPLANGKGLARLRRADRFGPWICTIAKRVAGRMARSRRERGVLEDTAAAPTPDSGPHPRDLVRQAVRDLPDKAREVVVLHYFTGLSHKDIATSLGLSSEAVHGRLVRARRMLADRLRGNGMRDLEL